MPYVSRSTPWAARAAFLRALHATAPQLLASLREQLPNHPFWLAHFHASRTVRDYAEDLEPADRGRAELARGEWLTRLTRWAAPYRLPRWFVESCEETLEIRRLLLLHGAEDPVPTTWQPAERTHPEAPVGIAHRELVWLVRYHLLGMSMVELAQAARADRKTVRLSVQAAADTLGITLRPPCRGGRGRRAVGDPRQLILRRAAFLVMPVKGVVR